MSKCYILDSTIVFDLEKCSLSPSKSAGTTVTLNYPVSRCLQLLLEKRPLLVRHNDFFDYVWPDAGPVILVNTLYQNISLLRKGLKTFGDNYGDMIVTVPRQGFKLNEKFDVQEINVDNAQAPKEIGDTELTSPSDPLAQGESVAIEYDVETKNQQITQRKKTAYPSFILIFTICIILGTLIGVNIANNTRNSPPFDSSRFNQTLTLGNCKLHFHNNSQWNISQAELEGYNIDCNATPYLYLSHYKYSTLRNIYACDAPMTPTTTPKCVSYNLLDKVEK